MRATLRATLQPCRELAVRPCDCPALPAATRARTRHRAWGPAERARGEFCAAGRNLLKVEGAGGPTRSMGRKTAQVLGLAGVWTAARRR